MVLPELYSHTIFQSDCNKKCYPVRNKLSCTDESNCFNSSCLKCWTDEDMEDLEENNNSYYCTCIDKLISFQKSNREDCSIESIINYPCSFNLDGVSIRSREEIELLHVII